MTVTLNLMLIHTLYTLLEEPSETLAFDGSRSTYLSTYLYIYLTNNRTNAAALERQQNILFTKHLYKSKTEALAESNY